MTLDLDNIPAGRTEDILRRVSGLGCNAAVYSTRKHCGYAPRLRVIVPLDRTATADEYEPAARKLASLIGIEFCDPTTFDVARLMYWPSCCRDSEYVCEVYDRPFCSLQGLLQMYGDWTDISQWPQVPGTDAVERRRLAKQENPTEKKESLEHSAEPTALRRQWKSLSPACTSRQMWKEDIPILAVQRSVGRSCMMEICFYIVIMQQIHALGSW